MKIKSIDIARELGISKATVSLALNGKTGVSEKTKQEIFACKQRLESNEKKNVEDVIELSGQMIKVILPSKNLHIIRDPELDLWTDVNIVFDKMAKLKGYTLGITYIDMRHDSAEQLAAECNAESVSGVILFGTELKREDVDFFKKIKKPMVIYDCDMECDAYSSVMVDNASGVKKAVDHLMQNQLKDIVYLAKSTDIYNYQQRRFGFKEALNEYNIPFQTDHMLVMGEKIESIYQNMKYYLETHALPDAFIMESYHLSVGAIRAFREKEICIPKDVSIIGIDELPGYMTGGCELTTIRIPHTERANMVMTMLFREIENEISFKSKIFTSCRLIKRNSVKRI